MKESAYFEAQAHLEVSTRIEDLMFRNGVTIDELASKMELDATTVRECLDDGEKLTVGMIAEMLYHLGYGMLFTTKPLARTNYEQAEMWSGS